MKSPKVFTLLSIAFFTAEIVPSATKAIIGNFGQTNSSNIITADVDVSRNECKTPTCIYTATQIQLNMDDRVEPCDDFYRFACGGFINRSTIPNYELRDDAFIRLRENVQEQLKARIGEPSPPNEPKPFRMVKNFYKACMNQSAIEKQGLTPILDVLKKLGGWPVLEGDHWDESAFDWRDSIIELHFLGYLDQLLKFRIDVDMKNSTHRIIELDQASLGIPNEYLLMGIDNKIVKAYYSYMVDIAVILGADRAHAEKELKQSLAFEMELANISLPNEKRRDATLLYNPMTVGDLVIAYPSIPWRDYFKKFFSSSHPVNDEDIVIISVPSYLSSLEKQMNKTSKRVQANYMMWRTVAASVSYLDNNIRKRQLAFLTALSGKTEWESRWKECIAIVSDRLSMSVSALYIRKYFDEDAKKNAIEMVTDIRNQFNQILRDVKWMDDETRKSAIDKAASMSSHIAYPDQLLDDSKLEEFYKNLEVSENDYFHNILKTTLFLVKTSFSKLKVPYNKNDWTNHGNSAVVNAFYSPIENSIRFPAAILQSTFFNSERPRYMNYGAIGFVIGHEITHGFDDQGRQFDKEGNLVDWWAPSTRQKYLEKAECIINQYRNYTVPEVQLNLNGINTQGENIADNGGIKVAYLAYKAWSSRNSPEPRLPGLERFSPSQMFWISTANTWCSKYRPEALKLRITTGFHSPGEFRILGPLSNMPEFAEDFKCPVGSKMNPVEKCAVW